MDDSRNNIDCFSDAKWVPTLHARKTSVTRTTFRYAIRIGVPALIIIMWFGLFPPWPVLIVLGIGVVAAGALLVAKRPVIAAASAFIAIVISAWLLRDNVDVRAAVASDRVYDRYFGIDSHGDLARETKITNILVATGTFTLNTWISASLYHVKSGEAEEINAFAVGRSPNQIGAPHWVDMKITFALGDRNGPDGRITQLGSAGQSRGGGRGGEVAHDVQRHSSQIFPGRFTSGSKRVVYVEGDAGFTIDHTMTAERFAKENNGNYLVVELQLN